MHPNKIWHCKLLLFLLYFGLASHFSKMIWFVLFGYFNQNSKLVQQNYLFFITLWNSVSAFRWPVALGISFQQDSSRTGHGPPSRQYLVYWAHNRILVTHFTTATHKQYGNYDQVSCGVTNLLRKELQDLTLPPTHSCRWCDRYYQPYDDFLLRTKDKLNTAELYKTV